MVYYHDRIQQKETAERDKRETAGRCFGAVCAEGAADIVLALVFQRMGLGLPGFALAVVISAGAADLAALALLFVPSGCTILPGRICILTAQTGAL